ncbi:MAG: hypothetical protein AAF581_02365 [Planctomycetota bacterium]
MQPTTKQPPQNRTTRRQLLRGAAALGLAAAFVPATAAQDAAAPDAGSESDAVAKAERDHVMAAGMTAGEAYCWVAAADAAGKFFALPEVHPMDKQEVASAIHVLQNKLLSRPTYRRYLESHGAPGKASK